MLEGDELLEASKMLVVETGFRVFTGWLTSCLIVSAFYLIFFANACLLIVPALTVLLPDLIMVMALLKLLAILLVFRSELTSSLVS